MNCTKIIPPSSAFIDFYYHYSNFVLLLCLLIAPLQFYIILTKSQKLKSFKWLILNHSFWSLSFEIIFTLLKPLFLPPAFAFYPIGIFQNQSLQITGIILYFGLLIGVTSSTSLTVTIVSRYLFAFPTKLIERLNMKYIKILYFLLNLAIYCGDTFLAINYFLTTDRSHFLHAAIEYDPCMQILIDQEPGFVFMPITSFTHLILVLLVIMYIGGISGASFVAIYFIYIVKSQKSQTLEKLQRSLIISAIVQISVTLSLLYIPFAIFLVIICFKLSHLENIVIILFCIVFSHSFFETVATLYFVAPYRKGVTEIFLKLFPYFNNALSKTVLISPITQNEMSSYLKNVCRT